MGRYVKIDNELKLISSGPTLPGYAHSIIHHGNDPDVSRPPELDIVTWVGDVEPNNWQDGDIWEAVGEVDNLEVDYMLKDGSRAFTGTVEGQTPTSNFHLTTKQYVDNADIHDHNTDYELSGTIETHNTSGTAHSDIRLIVDDKADQVALDGHINDSGDPHSQYHLKSEHGSSGNPHTQYLQNSGDTIAGILTMDGSIRWFADNGSQLSLQMDGNQFQIWPSGSSFGAQTILIGRSSNNVEIPGGIINGLNVSGGLTHNMPIIVRRRTTSLNVSNNSHTLLSYNVVDESQGASFGSSQSVFTIPETGIYIVNVNAAFGGTSGTEGYTQNSVTLNSTSVTAGSLVLAVGAVKTGIQNNGGASGQITGSSAPLFLNAGNTLRSFVYQRTGGDLSISLRNDIPTIAIRRVG